MYLYIFLIIIIHFTSDVNSKNIDLDFRLELLIIFHLKLQRLTACRTLSKTIFKYIKKIKYTSIQKN